MTKTHTETKTRWFLRSIFFNNSSKCSPDPEKPEFGVFHLGGAPHKVDLLRRPVNSYKTPAEPQMYAHTHTKKTQDMITPNL